MQKVYNVAIIGCGQMGVELLFDVTIPFTYSFAGAIFKNQKTKLVALIDADTKKLDDTAKRLRQDRYPSDFGCYASLDEAVASCKENGVPIDIVCCAAGPKVNEMVIRRAKELGIRGVYCEKPLTLSLAEADGLVSIEKESPVKIQVNYLRNFDTCHLAILDYIRKGGIGELLEARVLYKGGVCAVAPHAFALLHLLFGKPLEVYGCYSPIINTRCPEDPNIDGIVRYHFPTQKRDVNVSVMATGRGDIKNDTYIFELEFTGTEARILSLDLGFKIRYEKMEPSRIFIGETAPYYTERIPFELRDNAPREFFLEGLQRLIDAIECATVTNNGSVELSRDAEEVAHALAISAKEGKVTLLPIVNRDHTFSKVVAGVKVLREEAGIKN